MTQKPIKIANLAKKNSRLKTNLLLNYRGVTEIRTRDTLLTYTRFPGVPLQPLEHHSLHICACKGNEKIV